MPDIEKEFIFLRIPFLSLYSIKKPLHIDLTSKNNSFLAKLLKHLLRSQSPYFKKLFFVYFVPYNLFKLHCICADFVLPKILSKSQVAFILQDIMLKASTHSKTRRKTCPRHIACLGHAILLFCSTGKCLFKVNNRNLFKN